MKGFTWRKWRAGLFIAIGLALTTAGAGLMAGMKWQAFVAVFCTAVPGFVGTYLKNHPIEDIDETKSSTP